MFFELGIRFIFYVLHLLWFGVLVLLQWLVRIKGAYVCFRRFLVSSETYAYPLYSYPKFLL